MTSSGFGLILQNMLYRFIALLAIISGIAVLALFLCTGVHGTLVVLHGPLTLFRGRTSFLRVLLLICFAGSIIKILHSQSFTLASQKFIDLFSIEIPVYSLVCCFRC